MRNLSLSLGLVLVVGSAWLSACGTTAPMCSSSTCDTCCGSDGQCVRLSSDSACGRGGIQCKACGASEMCSFGSCVSTSFGSGGGVSGAGGGLTTGGGASGGLATGGGASGGLATGGGASAGGSAGGLATGGGSASCGPATCAGCCRSDATCNLAPTSQSCGSQGQLCRNCQSFGQTCSPATFSCVSGAGGGAGGGSAGGAAGGSAGGTAGGSANDNRLRLFVTSTTFSGNLGGLSGADMRCQTAATAGNKGGTWLAYLASATVTGPSRLTATGPWFQERADGTFILTYNNTANLQTGALSPLNTDEQGRLLSSASLFWTGMNNDSTTSFDTCSSWVSSSSSFDGTLGNGTSLFASTGSCLTAYRLVCIEQSRTPRPPPPPSVRKRVFVTSTTFNGNLGGLSGADMRCQTAATAGNKGGTWLAYLASASVTGPSRLTATGPWFQERADGTFILTYRNTANLQTGALSPLNTDEQGRLLSSASLFWTGMNNDSTTSFDTCSSWVSSSSSFDGTLGNGTSLFASTGSCLTAYRLVCIEQ